MCISDRRPSDRLKGTVRVELYNYEDGAKALAHWDRPIDMSGNDRYKPFPPHTTLIHAIEVDTHDMLD